MIWACCPRNLWCQCLYWQFLWYSLLAEAGERRSRRVRGAMKIPSRSELEVLSTAPLQTLISEAVSVLASRANAFQPPARTGGAWASAANSPPASELYTFGVEAPAGFCDGSGVFSGSGTGLLSGRGCASFSGGTRGKPRTPGSGKDLARDTIWEADPWCSCQRASSVGTVPEALVKVCPSIRQHDPLQKWTRKRCIGPPGLYDQVYEQDPWRRATHDPRKVYAQKPSTDVHRSALSGREATVVPRIKNRWPAETKECDPVYEQDPWSQTVPVPLKAYTQKPSIEVHRSALSGQEASAVPRADSRCIAETKEGSERKQNRKALSPRNCNMQQRSPQQQPIAVGRGSAELLSGQKIFPKPCENSDSASVMTKKGLSTTTSGSMSSPESSVLSPALTGLQSKAKELKQQGNVLFRANKLHDAREAYSEALLFMPTTETKDRAALFCNRAACLQKLSRWVEAVEDCQMAIELDPCYAKAYYRRCAAYEALSMWHNANEDLLKVFELDPEIRARESERQAGLEELAQQELEQAKHFDNEGEYA